MNRAVTLSILDGERRSAPSELSVQSLNGGELFLLVEASAPTATWDAACRNIIARAAAAFGGAERATEASALQAAVDAVSELLVASNRKLSPEEQVWASLNAAFIRKGHLYLAQAGPALTYVARGDSLTRFPKQPSDLQVDPLGVERGVRARMAHFQLQAGDRIALVSSQLPTFGPESELNALLKKEEIEEAANAFERLARQSDFSALFIHVEAVGEAPAPKPAPPPEPAPAPAPEPTIAAPAARGPKLPRPSVPTIPRRSAPAEPPPETAPPPDVDERAGNPARAAVSRVQARTSELRDRFTTGRQPAPATAPTGGAIVSTPRVASPPPATPAPAARQTTASSAASRPKAKAIPAAPAPPPAERATTAVLAATVVEEEPAHERPSFDLKRRFLLICYDLLYRLLALVDGALAFGSERAAPTLSKGAPLLERIGNALWRLFALLGRGLRRVLRQMLPGMHEGDDGPATTLPPEKRSTLASALLLLLPVVLLLVVAGVALMRDEGTTAPDGGAVVLTPAAESAASLLSDAASLLEQAATVDAATGQRLAGEAVALVDRAVALEPPLEGSAAVNDLRARAQALLTASGAVTTPPVTQLATLPDGSQPAEVAVGGGSPFALDRGAGAAFRVLLGRPEAVPLDPLATQPLLMAQQNLGNGVIVEPLAHLLWVPRGGSRPADALVILGQSGQLFEFEPESGILRNLPFATLTGESDIRAAEGFDGNLYLLDGAARQVWKYVPDAAGGYSQPPQPWLSAAAQGQLGDPIDIAVDGFIYLLDASGAVTRFQGGEAQPFALAPPPAPISGASALAKPAPESTDLFVADGARVLRFAQDGSFLKEYRAPAGQEWGAIRDLAFDGGGALYLLTDRGLYSLDVQ